MYHREDYQKLPKSLSIRFAKLTGKNSRFLKIDCRQLRVPWSFPMASAGGTAQRGFTQEDSWENVRRIRQTQKGGESPPLNSGIVLNMKGHFLEWEKKCWLNSELEHITSSASEV